MANGCCIYGRWERWCWGPNDVCGHLQAIYLSCFNSRLFVIRITFLSNDELKYSSAVDFYGAMISRLFGEWLYVFNSKRYSLCHIITTMPNLFLSWSCGLRKATRLRRKPLFGRSYSSTIVALSLPMDQVLWSLSLHWTAWINGNFFCQFAACGHPCCMSIWNLCSESLPW